MGIFGRKRVKAQRLDDLAELESMIDSGQPVLLDFWQKNCVPCRVMDGIVDELADEFQGSAHVVKINVRDVPGAVQKFRIQSTPTFVVLGPPKKSKKRAKRAEVGSRAITQRWRASGLVKKDIIARALESNGATRADL